MTVPRSSTIVTAALIAVFFLIAFIYSSGDLSSQGAPTMAEMEHDSTLEKSCENGGVGCNYVFASQAYRIADDEIRFIANLHNSRLDKLIFLYEVDSQQGTGIFECVNPQCEDNYDNSVIPFLGVIKSAQLPEKVEEFSVSLSRNAFTTLQVRDARRSEDAPKHTLAVFMEAAFYTADWTQYARYFEMWMDLGASKFFIYYHSVTQQVLDVVAFYKQHVDIELVPWSHFPVPQRSEDTLLDPNYFSFNLAQYAQTNDVLLRAKKDCAHLAIMDLDDLPLVMPGNNLLEILENSTTDEVFLPWMLARTMTIPRAQSLSEYEFDELRGFRYVQEDNEMNHAYHVLAKTILRPERVRLVEVHSGRVREHGGGLTTRVTLPHSVAVSVHLRGHQQSAVKHSLAGLSAPQHDLESTADRCADALRRRLNGTDVSLARWQNRYAHTIRAFEQCRFGVPRETYWERPLECCSIKACERYIPSSPVWLLAPQMWLDIDDSWQTRNWIEG